MGVETNNQINNAGFTCDQFNRIITTATPSGTPDSWSQSFVYDIWGNSSKITAGGAPGLCVLITPQNRLSTTCTGGTTFGYDGAGNMTGDGQSLYGYDAENRMTSAADVTYTYDGDGKRVQKSTGKLYWYGMGSDVLAESDAAGNITDEYIFFVGKRIARRKVASGEINYYFADHLGNSRVVTSATGQILDDSDFYPFGGERPVISGTDNNYLFTGKERDSESGLDNFGARMYASAMGRFTSVDPVTMKANRLLDPQRLNLYSYVRDSPMTHVDPDGRDAIAVGFPNYKIQTPVGKIGGLGHAGLITIDSKGHTRYFEYGRYDAQGKGIVRTTTVPDVQMDSNGRPTQKSLDKLMQAVSDKAGKGGKVEGAYFDTSDKQTQQMNQAAEAQQAQNSDPNREPYGLVTNNCATFCTRTLDAGGVDTPTILDPRPNSQIDKLQNAADAKLTYNPETKKTTVEEKKKPGEQK